MAKEKFKYRIPVVWQEMGYIEVEAVTEAEACKIVMNSTDQAQAPRLADLRVIALR